MTSKVKKPTKAQIRYADKHIAVLKALKLGKTIQRKSLLHPEWHDIDLARLLSPEAVQYRVKK